MSKKEIYYWHKKKLKKIKNFIVAGFEKLRIGAAS